MTFTSLKDLYGVLKVDPNSFIPYQGFFSKEIEEDFIFFCRLNTTITLLSEKYEHLNLSGSYSDCMHRYGSMGKTLRDAIELNPFNTTEREIREVIRFLFEGQTFTEVEKIVFNTSKSTNKLLVDIRKKGGQYPYRYLLEFSYYIDPDHPDFQGLSESRESCEFKIKDILEEFDQKIAESGLNSGHEWLNFFNALAFLPRGPGYDSMAKE